MKKFAKKNNKGFSLVELIVVVLIMAIIAVALAPQVMKWVNNARISADVTSYDSMISTVQLAYTNETVYSTCKDETYTVKIDTSGTTVTGASGSHVDTLKTEMTKLVADWDKVKAKVSDGDYQFTVKNGMITKTTGKVPSETLD